MAKAPMNPLAGPSGPGDKFSKRTDQLTLGSLAYGECQDDLAKSKYSSSLNQKLVGLQIM
jgi:hypothetical protein